MKNSFQWIFRKTEKFRSKDQRVLVFTCDSADCHSVLRFVNQIFQGSKINKVEHIISYHPWPDLAAFTTVVLLPGVVPGCQGKEVQRLKKFVSKGGGLFTVLPELTPQTSEFFSLVEAELSHPGFDEDFEDTVIFNQNIFPWAEDLTDEYPVNDTRVGLHPDEENVNILVEYQNGIPLVWQKDVGRGGVVVWNVQYFEGLKWRGIFLQCLLLSTPVTVLPVVNAASIQVDDFPAGFADLESPILREEFDMRFVEFLDKIWLPDLLKIGTEMEIPFTCCIPFSYNEKTAPPFDFLEWEAIQNQCGTEKIPAPVDFAKRLTGSNELAFHGYNHLSLTLGAWPSESAMAAGLQAAQKRWRSDHLGPDPVSYIPPMNAYDAAGIRALAKTFPSIHVICGTPYGAFDEGGGREFGPEPWSPNLFCVPRWTYGYVQKPTECLTMISQLSALGVWTHFIHPDDILDTETEPGQTWKPRNGEKRHWRTTERGGLLPAFRTWLREVRNRFPWLRFMTAEHAATAIKQHQDNRITVRFISSCELTITSDTPSDLMVRVRKDLGFPKFSNLTLLHQDCLPTSNLYTLRMQGCEGGIVW